MLQIASTDHQNQARFFRELYSIYEQNKELISLGAYRQGTDNMIDLSIKFRDSMREFLTQSLEASSNLEGDLEALRDLTDAFHNDGETNGSSKSLGERPLQA